MISNDIYINAILLFVSFIETDKIAALDRQTDHNGHDDLQTCVVATTHWTPTQQSILHI